ncbi:MAG: hypothetical protein Fues2KO_50640 [Fuerstiella sp.]
MSRYPASIRLSIAMLGAVNIAVGAAAWSTSALDTAYLRWIVSAGLPTGFLLIVVAILLTIFDDLVYVVVRVITWTMVAISLTLPGFPVAVVTAWLLLKNRQVLRQLERGDEERISRR